MSRLPRLPLITNLPFLRRDPVGASAVTPPGYGTSLELWFDAEQPDGSNHPIDLGTQEIGSLVGQGGAGITYNSSGGLNGAAYWAFDGTNNSWYKGTITDIPKPYTIWVLAKNTDPGGADTAPGGVNGACRATITNQQRPHYIGVGPSNPIITPTDNSAWAIFYLTVRSDDTQTIGFINSSEQTTGAGTVASLGGSNVTVAMAALANGALEWEGHVQELGVNNAEITVAEMLTYIQARGG